MPASSNELEEKNGWSNGVNENNKPGEYIDVNGDGIVDVNPDTHVGVEDTWRNYVYYENKRIQDATYTGGTAPYRIYFVAVNDAEITKNGYLQIIKQSSL